MLQDSDSLSQPKPVEIIGTPNSREGFSSQDMCTPTQKTPVRNRVLESLIKGDVSSKSPVLKIPATPIMERLGYGTGVGVFLLERSPRPGGVTRSPWAIKKTVKVEETSELFSARIEYEAEILRQLSHPHIIGYRAFGKPSPNGDAFLAMEKANTSLADLIDERVEEVLLTYGCDETAPFPAKRMEKVTLDVSKALAYLHDEVKMVHGDLKSANVLVFGDFETIKLCDFGVSRKLTKDGTVEGSYIGTEIWNSMEVALAKKGQDHAPITHKADMFAFGLTIHEMMTLKPPHLSSAEDSYIESHRATNTSGAEGEASESESFEQSFDDAAYEDSLQRFIGTRPLLPSIEFDSSYNTILGVFYCCTEEDPVKRPDAKDIIAAIGDLEK